MEFSHQPVLFTECMNGLSLRPDGVYIDGTAGGGGHSSGIASALSSGHLYAFDRDSEALAAAKKKLSSYEANVTLLHREFSQMEQAMAEQGVTAVDGILLDIGVSSYQLDNPERGFTYMAEAPLDMRMRREQAFSAYDIVNTYSEKEIEDILFTYGEERWARRIAQFIVAAREKKPLETTFELNEIIRRAVPAKARADGSHPSKRTFQALRIVVNNELGELSEALEAGCRLLRPGGRFCVITFHSLEDRIVKRFFAQKEKGCVCPPELPVCVCGRKPELKLIGRKPVEASERELNENPRSHSAKLRVAEKL